EISCILPMAGENGGVAYGEKISHRLAAPRAHSACAGMGSFASAEVLTCRALFERQIALTCDRMEDTMKWVTRANVKVDRVACPWLIRTFVDPEGEFLFVPIDQVEAVV